MLEQSITTPTPSQGNVVWVCFGRRLERLLECFMSDPPRAKRALIFVRREHPAAFEKLVETGETVQGMFLSTSEEAGKVAGWPGGFLGSHFWRNPSQI